MSKKANGLGTYRHLPSGNWQVQAMDGYREDGKKKYVYFTAPTKSEAKLLLMAYRNSKEKELAENSKATPSNEDRKEVCPIGFLEVADQWYQTYSTQVQPSTYAGYRYTLNILKNHLMDTPIDTILPMHINQLLDTLAATPYSRSCITKCRAMLIQILDYAEANQMISTNPARKAKVMRIFSIPTQPKDAFTDEEVNLLRSNLPNDLLGNSICLLIGTGMRVQELLALRPADFASDFSSVQIQQAIKTVDGKPTLGSPKSRCSYRTIPIPQNYRSYAENLLVHGGKALIWTSSRENLLYSVGTFRKRYYKALKRIPCVRPLPPHCCRHTYSTMLQARGIPIEMVARLMGHKNIQTTENYTHTKISTLAAAVAVLNEQVT